MAIAGQAVDAFEALDLQSLELRPAERLMLAVRQNKLATAGFAIVVLALALSLIAPLLYTVDPLAPHPVDLLGVLCGAVDGSGGVDIDVLHKCTFRPCRHNAMGQSDDIALVVWRK